MSIVIKNQIRDMCTIIKCFFVIVMGLPFHLTHIRIIRQFIGRP